MNRSEIEEALSKCEFFKELEKDDIGKIADLCKVDSFKAGEYVFEQGDFGEYIYIIAEGQVALERSVDLGSRKGNVTIGALGKGRVMGCWSTLLGQPHNLMSSACCQKPARIIILEGAHLRKMMLENKTLGFNVMERFCFLLRDRIQAAYGAMEKF